MKIAIFTGHGTTPKTRWQAHEFAKNLYPQAGKFDVTGESIRNGLLCEAHMLIMPGGASRKMMLDLQQTGAKNIKKFTQNGGLYLGFCGGAFVASAKIKFAVKNSKIETTHPLQHFSGLSNGPLNRKFHYNSAYGFEAIKLHFHKSGKTLHAYLDGGGYFVNPEADENVEVIASYPCGKAAFIKCTVGAGTAFLCHPHFEYSPNLIKPDNQGYIKKEDIQTFANENAERLALWQEILRPHVNEKFKAA